tara:strand:+ start:604 stop:1296 length:693 start_codon:yes stop_codon:yes gene_type:complete
MKENNLSYDTDIEILLKANAEECESLSLLHRSSYEKYNKLSNIINVPVIVLSSAIGFATGIEIGYEKINIVLGVASIFVGIIKSIDSYFALPKRAEGHRICSLQYAQINKRIAVELSLKREQRQNPKDMLGLIKTDMKNLADIAPLIDYDIIETFKNKYRDSEGHFATNTANICNGLTPVVINRTEVVENPPENRVVSNNPPPEINKVGSGEDILKQQIVDIPLDDIGAM